MFRTAIFIAAILSMYTPEAVSKSAESTEDPQIAKFADKVIQLDDELIFRLKDGALKRKKSRRCDDGRYTSYTFYDFIEPWFIVEVTYFEWAGTTFINWETGKEEYVSGASDFSSERTRFLAIGSPSNGEYDADMWKVTPDGVFKEWTLDSGSAEYKVRWLDSTTVEVAQDDHVVARVTRNGASWKCFGAVRACNGLEISKSRGDIPAEVVREKKQQRHQGVRDPETSKVTERVDAHDEDSEEDVKPTLRSAAEEGDVEAVQSFLDKGIPIDATDEDGWTALERAAYGGRLDVVKFLLSRGARANSKEYLNPPIILAAHSGKAEIVKALLDNGADPNATGVNACTALMRSVWKGHIEIVRLLLEKGADPNARDDYNSTALTGPYNSLWRGNPQIVKMLLDRGADPNAQDVRGQSALKSAASEGDLEMMKLLLDHGANPNSALHQATFRDQTAAVKLLLDRGAKPIRVDNIHKPETVKILLENRSDVNLSDKDGITAVMEAAGAGYPDIVKRLLDRGADVNAKDAHGWNALAWAAGAGHYDIAALLKKHGAEMTFMAAVCLPDIAEVQRRLNNGSDINAKGINAALVGAAALGHSDVVKLLLDKGADANAKDENRETALIMAVSKGHFEVVKLLLEKGADVNMKAVYCKTALDIAQIEQRGEIEAVLRAHGAEDRDESE